MLIGLVLIHLRIDFIKCILINLTVLFFLLKSSNYYSTAKRIRLVRSWGVHTGQGRPRSSRACHLLTAVTAAGDTPDRHRTCRTFLYLHEFILFCWYSYWLDYVRELQSTTELFWKYILIEIFSWALHSCFLWAFKIFQLLMLPNGSLCHKHLLSPG